MPRPRHERVAVTLATISRPEKSSAEAQYRHRHGLSHVIMRPVRNGLPEPVRYVYSGTGEDIYLGSYGDPRLDEPDA